MRVQDESFGSQIWTCRSFEDVRWDIKLPQRLKPPATTLEKMADPVNQHFTLKRYNSKPELWQVGSCTHNNTHNSKE